MSFELFLTYQKMVTFWTYADESGTTSQGVCVGGGGTLIFSAYVGSDPASALHPKRISGISSTPKKYLKF